MAKPRNNRRLVENALIARLRPCDPWGGRPARGTEGYAKRTDGESQVPWRRAAAGRPDGRGQSGPA